MKLLLEGLEFHLKFGQVDVEPNGAVGRQCVREGANHESNTTNQLKTSKLLMEGLGGRTWLHLLQKNSRSKGLVQPGHARVAGVHAPDAKWRQSLHGMPGCASTPPMDPSQARARMGVLCGAVAAVVAVRRARRPSSVCAVRCMPDQWVGLCVDVCLP